VAIEVTMPKFGLTMHDGTLQRYFKAPGEALKVGEPLYEVETEKVLFVVEVPVSGTLALWLHAEGAVVECGGLVAVIAEANEDAAAFISRYKAAEPMGQITASEAPQSRAAIATATAGASIDVSPDVSPPASEGRRAVSPVARKLAAELGVNLARVNGTGPGGRITREDVERAAQAGANAPADPAAQASAASSSASEMVARSQLSSVPVRGMRKTIAARMHQSLRDSAQLTISTEADVTSATDLRARLTREFEFTYTDLLIHAIARALLRHPRMNSRFSEDAIALLAEVHVGMAVALDEGLIVPVIRNADRKSLREIAASTKDLGERARTGKLKIEDVSGGTFTVTNLGTWGIDAFTPILNPGETGILGVGRIIEKPAIHRGEIAKRSMLTLSLTFDHRAIDGAPAASFLRTVVDIFNYGDR
jgi:pyruvate dehydrogenase E2 component (dihydrolipoamide acetyltransferase)